MARIKKEESIFRLLIFFLFSYLNGLMIMGEKIFFPTHLTFFLLRRSMKKIIIIIMGQIQKKFLIRWEKKKIPTS